MKYLDDSDILRLPRESEPEAILGSRADKPLNCIVPCRLSSPRSEPRKDSDRCNSKAFLWVIEMEINKTRLVHGFGINNSGYPVSVYGNVGGKRKLIWNCPFYQVWAGMIRRCYSIKFQSRCPTYSGCVVIHEWHSFSVFRAWMLTQPWEGNQLDKDILYPGNKVYGPDTCVFVSRQLNIFLTDRFALRGEWPIGVSWHKRIGKFTSHCNNPFAGNLEFLGYFVCPSAAHEAWRARKHEHACRYADMQTDTRISDALRIRYSKNG